jgi:FtsP/CotA-like multicopper oxidase with cupredoxin domain
LKAEMVTQQILPDGDGATSMLGFNGSMPGPELRVQRGERVNIKVENGLEEGTAGCCQTNQNSHQITGTA